jgi:protease II
LCNSFKTLQIKADPAQPDPDRPDRNKEQICHFEDIKCAEDLDQVSTEVVWQNFERLAAFIFEENNFQATTNTVKTLKRKRRQYDVIAKTNSKTFLVECKKWAGNRSRLSALKKAIERHIERTEFYRDLTRENAIPIIVTLIEEEIRSYEGVPIVPILRLNSFINELDNEALDDQ